MHNWRVGSVGSVSGENFWGVGFVLYDEIAKPCLTFGYFNESSAKAGREHVVAALANAASVTGREGDLAPILAESMLSVACEEACFVHAPGP
jgi:hypothetical protein